MEAEIDDKISPKFLTAQDVEKLIDQKTKDFGIGIAKSQLPLIQACIRFMQNMNKLTNPLSKEDWKLLNVLQIQEARTFLALLDIFAIQADYKKIGLAIADRGLTFELEDSLKALKEKEKELRRLYDKIYHLQELTYEKWREGDK